jgi:hypothetical protein
MLAPACGRSKTFTGLRPKQNFHRPAAGEALFTAEKDPKRLAPGARRLGSCLVDPLRILATAGRRRTHTSMCSNSGAYSLRLPAMLAALYGALSHSTALPCATCLLPRFIPQWQCTTGAASA